MSNLASSIAGFRGIGAGMLPNDVPSVLTIPGLVPGGAPPIPGVINGDRLIPEPLTPQPDPAALAPKVPIFLGTPSEAPPTVNVVQSINDFVVPSGYVDYNTGPNVTSSYWVPEVVIPPPSDYKGGITFLLDNLDKNPIAVAITGFILGTIGGAAPGTTGTVVTYVIGGIDLVTTASAVLTGGTPTMSSQRIQKVTVNSTPTGLTVGGIPSIGTWNTTAYTTYQRIPISGSLINNTITIRGFTMDFKNTGLGETAQIDINVPIACTDEFFYAPNADDPLMGEDHYYQMWGVNSAGVSQTALAKVKMLGSGGTFPAGYRDTVNIEISNFPVTAAPSGSLYLPTITLNYITRLDTTYMRDYLGATATF
jgi:hypothetical protein